MSQRAKLFELNWAALDVRRGVAVTVVLSVLTVVVLALGQQNYLLSVMLGVVWRSSLNRRTVGNQTLSP